MDSTDTQSFAARRLFTSLVSAYHSLKSEGRFDKYNAGNLVEPIKPRLTIAQHNRIHKIRMEISRLEKTIRLFKANKRIEKEKIEHLEVKLDIQKSLLSKALLGENI